MFVGWPFSPLFHVLKVMGEKVGLLDHHCFGKLLVCMGNGT